MAVEIEDLYTNLNKLLDDICAFLSNEGNYEKLSLLSRRQADELIKRSKIQLQQIEKIQSNNHEPDEAYVDMERKSVIAKDDDKNNIYSSVDENAQNTENIPKTDPYRDLPFKDLSQDIKFGQLSWKTRIILNFEKTRRVFAGIHDKWLLIYSNEKDDQKPIQTFDLKFHQAKTVIYKQGKSPSQDFELTSTIETKKTYYFVALTHKDMLQWVTNINRCHNIVSQTRKSLSNNSDISETYDTIINTKEVKNNYIDNSVNNNDDDDDIYHDIEPLSNIENKNDNVRQRNNRGKEDKPPDLPIRGKLKKIDAPLPPIPPIKKTDSIQSLETYDSVVSKKSTESSGNDDDDEDDNSFSDSETDDIYEVFVTTATIEQKPKELKDKNKFLLVKEKPAIKEKPKHLINLRKL